MVPRASRSQGRWLSWKPRSQGVTGRAGAANVGFQTALSFPTLSAGSNQGREAGYMQAGFVHRTKGKADRQDQQAGVRLAHHMPQPYLGTHRELYS